MWMLTTLAVLSCADPNCRGPLAQAPDALPPTWEALVASDRCVQTTRDGDDRYVLDGQCETNVGGRYDLDGNLSGLYLTDDTGQCTRRYGIGTFSASPGIISPGCATHGFFGIDAFTARTSLEPGTRTPRTDCHGVRTCEIDGVAYTAELDPDPQCHVPTMSVYDADGQRVAMGDYLVWSGPDAFAACGQGTFEPSAACGFVD